MCFKSYIELPEGNNDHVPDIYLYLTQWGWVMPDKMLPLEFERD